MKALRTAVCCVSAAVLLTVLPGSLAAQGSGRAVVTVLPKVDGQLPSSVTQRDLSVKVGGKNARVTTWAPYQSPNNQIELVLLIDGAARSSLGRQMQDIQKFIQGLPPNVHAGIAYMQNGQAVFAGPLTLDHAQVLANLHLPLGMPGSNASPYFCLSDLAKRWPGRDAAARREVVMITDGIDNYERRYDPEDPYVQAAITDAARARLVVYSIYWMNQGRMDRTEYGADDGQNLLVQVAESTGGKSFWQGLGNPVSFEPYFNELNRRLRNQYELQFETTGNVKAGVVDMKLSLHAPGTEIDAPKQVLVTPGATAEK